MTVEDLPGGLTIELELELEKSQELEIVDNLDSEDSDSPRLGYDSGPPGDPLRNDFVTNDSDDVGYLAKDTHSALDIPLI